MEKQTHSKSNFCSKLHTWYIRIMTVVMLAVCLTIPSFAAENPSASPAPAASRDMWTVANNLIVDVYTHIAGISTVLAGLMSAVAVIGAKLSNNQHKVDQAWDWLKRIWIAWAIINGIGAFIAYITPLFAGLATLTP